MPSAQLYSPLFRHPTVDVLAPHGDAPDGPGGWLCVSFASRGNGRPRLFGGDFFSRYCIPAIYVVPQRNDWYQAGGMPDALQAIRAHAQERPILAYGSSMGGFGALACARELGAQRIVAISPQVGVAPHSAGRFDRRWRAETARITEYPRPDARRGGLARRDSLIIFDPRHPLDARHAHLIRAAAPRRVRTLELAFAGHPAGRAAAAAGTLSMLLRGLCSDGDFDTVVRQARAQYRRSELRARLVTTAFQYYARSRPHLQRLARDMAVRHGQLAADTRITGQRYLERWAARS